MVQASCYGLLARRRAKSSRLSHHHVFPVLQIASSFTGAPYKRPLLQSGRNTMSKCNCTLYCVLRIVNEFNPIENTGQMEYRSNNGPFP